MSGVKLWCFMLISTVPVQSEQITFKIAGLIEKGQSIGVIFNAIKLKEHLPNRSMDELEIHGQMPIIYEDSIGNISTVRQLILQTATIVDVGPYAFRNSEFQILEFQYARFPTLRKNVLSDMIVKEFVIANNTKFETIEEDALDNPHIEVLNFTRNIISSFYKNTFRNMPNLKNITLCNNGIEKIDKDLYENLPIISLDLSENSISKVKFNFSTLPNLVRVALDGNRIKAISAGPFSNHPTLQEVSLSSNRIHFISSDAFDNMPQLRAVNFDDNKLTRIDSDWFYKCPNLRKIRICYNNLTKIPDEAFKNLNRELSVKIYVHFNKLRKVVPSAFRGLKIDTLNLAFNKFKKWSANYLAEAKYVGTLNLRGSSVHRLVGDMNDIFIAEKTILIANPMGDEEEEEIKEWLRENRDGPHSVCYTRIGTDLEGRRCFQNELDY